MLDSLIIPSFFLLYSRHLSVSYYIDVVRRNSVLVSQGMFKGS